MKPQAQQLVFVKTMIRTLLRSRHGGRSALDSFRDRALERLLREARDTVPFQRKRLAKAGDSPIRLEDVPPTDKVEMMEHFNDTIADGVVTLDDVLKTDEDPNALEIPIVKRNYLVSKTSGSSGRPSWIVQSLQDWSMTRAAAFSRMSEQWLTIRRLIGSLVKPLRCATVGAEHALSMTWQACKSAQLTSGRRSINRFYSILMPVEEMAASLNEHQPEYLHGYPTALQMLAQYKLAGGDCRIEPRLISVGSEKLTRIAADAIRSAFPRSKLVDHYGMTECLPLSTTCSHGNLHLNIDFCVLELMDSCDRPVPPGELSDHVLVTNLFNRVQPLIRYRVNDSVRMVPEPCPCGSVRPVIEVFSRKGDLIYLRDERGRWQLLSPPVVVDTILHTHGIAQYQLTHVAQNQLHVKIQPEPHIETEKVAANLTQEFQRTLRQLGCSNSVTIRVEAVRAFERTAGGGKLQQMISLVPEPNHELRQTA